MLKSLVLLSICLGLSAGLVRESAWAGPICCPGPSGPTFAEEINAAQIAVIARLTERQEGDTAKFEIVQVLKGAEHVKDVKQITVPYFGQQPLGTRFLILRGNPAPAAWKMRC